MNGTYFFYEMNLQIKQILKSHQIQIGSGKKIINKTNYWSKDSQRSSETLYKNTPKYICRQLTAGKINILQVSLFLDFIWSNGNSDVKSKQRF